MPQHGRKQNQQSMHISPEQKCHVFCVCNRSVENFAHPTRERPAGGWPGGPRNTQTAGAGSAPCCSQLGIQSSPGLPGLCCGAQPLWCLLQAPGADRDARANLEGGWGAPERGALQGWGRTEGDQQCGMEMASFLMPRPGDPAVPLPEDRPHAGGSHAVSCSHPSVVARARPTLAANLTSQQWPPLGQPGRLWAALGRDLPPLREARAMAQGHGQPGRIHALQRHLHQLP